MSKDRQSTHRPVWLSLLSFSILCLAASLTETLLSTLAAYLAKDPDLRRAAQLFSSLPAIAVILLLCRVLLGLRPKDLLLKRTHLFRDYLLGALLGGGLFAAAVGICLLAGAVKIEGTSDAATWRWLTVSAGLLFQGAKEELLCRGFLLPSVADRTRPWVGVCVSAAAFALLHLGNEGISPIALLNLALFGILTALIALRRGSLWLVCALHSAWNIAEGCIFGASVSGTARTASLLCTVADPTRALWNGGAFGPEGGLAVTIPLCAAIVAATVLGKRGDLAANKTATEQQ